MCLHLIPKSRLYTHAFVLQDPEGTFLVVFNFGYLFPFVFNLYFYLSDAFFYYFDTLLNSCSALIWEVGLFEASNSWSWSLTKAALQRKEWFNSTTRILFNISYLSYSAYALLVLSPVVIYIFFFLWCALIMHFCTSFCFCCQPLIWYPDSNLFVLGNPAFLLFFFFYARLGSCARLP